MVIQEKRWLLLDYSTGSGKTLTALHML